MWANSFWGLLGLAATFGLAMLLLTPEQEWLRERQSILFAEARVVLVHHVDKIEVVFANFHKGNCGTKMLPQFWVLAPLYPPGPF
jgi:hypothetical protein